MLTKRNIVLNQGMKFAQDAAFNPSSKTPTVFTGAGLNPVFVPAKPITVSYPIQIGMTRAFSFFGQHLR